MSEASPHAQMLSDARVHFERGNYKKAREIAESLLSSSASANSADLKNNAKKSELNAETIAAAHELLSEMSPPGLTKYLLALTLVLLTAVTLFAYLQ